MVLSTIFYFFLCLLLTYRAYNFLYYTTFSKFINYLVINYLISLIKILLLLFYLLYSTIKENLPANAIASARRSLSIVVLNIWPFLLYLIIIIFNLYYANGFIEHYSKLATTRFISTFSVVFQNRKSAFLMLPHWIY